MENRKRKLFQEIENSRVEIINIGEAVLNHAELGYREEYTSSMVRETFEKLGIAFEYPLAVTGVKATVNREKKGPNICIIGEMDAVVCNTHPYAGVNGVAHACGHHAQVAAMLGAAIGLVKSGVAEQLDGKITFMAVPAEEFIDLEYRKTLQKEKKIQYFGGKQQLIAEGAFDDVDIAIMLHAQPEEPRAKLYVRGNNLGFLAKTITFHGQAAHGSRPHEGTNALNAAALAILGFHSNRETFTEEEKIRIHPIITKGGDVVNSVPDEVCIETYVRGASFEAIQKGNLAVERSVNGASQMIGTTVTIENMVGYLPIRESTALSEVVESVAVDVMGEDCLVFGEPITGSTDMGDLSAILPVVQPSIGGFSGNLHGASFRVADPEIAYIDAAKILAATVVELLENSGEKANRVIKDFKPVLSKEDYLNYLKGES